MKNKKDIVAVKMLSLGGGYFFVDLNNPKLKKYHFNHPEMNKKLWDSVPEKNLNFIAYHDDEEEWFEVVVPAEPMNATIPRRVTHLPEIGEVVKAFNKWGIELPEEVEKQLTVW